MYFSACFFNRNSVFPLQQISQRCFSAGLSAQPNRAYILAVSRLRARMQKRLGFTVWHRFSCSGLEYGTIHVTKRILNLWGSCSHMTMAWFPAVQGHNLQLSLIRGGCRERQSTSIWGLKACINSANSISMDDRAGSLTHSNWSSYTVYKSKLLCFDLTYYK
jgi:hypothetical protein